ncbi:MAG: hypothetical protein A3G87_00170 [Omnitrophica bacterium RIFCSPLOWO2_12_FULL_50_11]|nr:MAG: hypothetical protein A3G87_00170 [Omnitrophica bacterium RIFCSPLOWO2_12_FULL_50_11]
MTCNEAAELIYTFAETKPSREAQREFQAHVKKCKPCRDFITGIGKKVDAHFDVNCCEIPERLPEIFSRLMKENLKSASRT